MKNEYRTGAVFGVDEHGTAFKSEVERADWEAEQKRDDDDRHHNHGDGPLITGF